MKTLPLNAKDHEILDFVKEWVDVLAREDYQGAFSMTGHDPYYGWTPEHIQSVINGYGLPEPTRDGKIYRITQIDEAKGGCKPRHEVEYFDSPKKIGTTRDTAIGEVWCAIRFFWTADPVSTGH
jgi:hypothetical protein